MYSRIEQFYISGVGEGCDAAKDSGIENQDGTVCLRSQGRK